MQRAFIYGRLGRAAATRVRKVSPGFATLDSRIIAAMMYGLKLACL